MSDPSSLRPIPLEGVMDYHVHCDYSIDAEGSVEDYCEAALKRNLAEICFTTHFDANPKNDGKANFIRINGENMPVSPENLEPYVKDVQIAAEKYYLYGLSVKLGVEFGWYPGCEKVVEDLKDRYPFDYILCGIHEIENTCFCCRRTHKSLFEKYTAERLAAAYFEQANRAVETGLFDTVAHLEYIIRYGYSHYGEDILKATSDHVGSILEALTKTETALEINTSGLRHGFKEGYPRMETVNAARKAGVQIAYLGSDAHKPEQVGYDFELAISAVPDSIRACED